MQVNSLSDEMRKYFSGPEWRAFRGSKKAMPQEMKVAFGQCVGPIHAVPVRGSPDQRFVLEVDITPDAAICEKIVFAYTDVRDNGQTKRKFRHQAGNVDLSTVGGEDAVRKAAHWRAEQELQCKKNAMLAEADQLGHADKSGLFAHLNKKIAEVINVCCKDGPHRGRYDLGLPVFWWEFMQRGIVPQPWLDDRRSRKSGLFPWNGKSQALSD